MVALPQQKKVSKLNASNGLFRTPNGQVCGVAACFTWMDGFSFVKKCGRLLHLPEEGLSVFPGGGKRPREGGITSFY